MAWIDLQNSVGRTFETQAIYQQVVSQADQALRQAERRLAEERLKKQDLVEESAESAPSDALDLDLNRRENHEGRDKDRRYRLALRSGGEQSVEPEGGPGQAPGNRIDLRI